MLYSEAIKAKETGELVNYLGFKYRILGYRFVNSSAHPIWTVQRIALNSLFEKVEVDEQTIAAMTKSK
ncbi:hypothetical protein [Limosilactobacillus pontis]|uniref:Uncharacterized protein n=1 Tax=Limosilactobacillus pontis TaxID=35787 RepID=A0ABU7SUP9_9LACO